jgi:hypothetical protein
MAALHIKRGATLAFAVNFTLQGAPCAISSLNLSAQVRDAEFNLVATLAIEPTSTLGQAQVMVQDTSAWPEGLLRLDVLAQVPGGVQALSETFGIFVERAVTQLLPEQAPYDPVTDA